MTDRQIDKLITGPYRYGTVLPTGEIVTIGTQLALRRRLRAKPPALPPSPALSHFPNR